MDLSAFLIENKGDLVVDRRKGQGRLAVASRPLSTLYEIVVRERPALIWRSDDFCQFLLQFRAAGKGVQDAILDMYHPPLDGSGSDSDSSDSSGVAGLREGARELASMRILEEPHQNDPRFIHKLLAIANTNTHEYYGARHSGTSMSALFLFGSKINHSCHPNMTYT